MTKWLTVHNGFGRSFLPLEPRQRVNHHLDHLRAVGKHVPCEKWGVGMEKAFGLLESMLPLKNGGLARPPGLLESRFPLKELTNYGFFKVTR